MSDDFEVDDTVPDWNSPDIVEEKCLKTPPHVVNRLSDIRDGKLTLEKPCDAFEFKLAPNPFVDGSKYWVFYATDLVRFRKIVLKRFKNSNKLKLTIDHYMKQLEIRLVATAYAREFNRDKSKPQDTCSIEFAPLDVVQCSEGGTVFLQEPLLKGTVENLDRDRRLPYFDLLQAFTHYTWIKSRKRLIICNHQGFKERMKRRLTLIDPTIHTVESESKYGQQDVGKDGIKAFFDGHKCSTICEQMKLDKS